MPPTSTPGRSLRILVVEDNEDTLKCLGTYLEDFGHVVTSSRNIAEAVKQASSSDYDVLISDIGLQDGTGWELLPNLRKQNVRPHTTIAVSGLGRATDFTKSKSAGYQYHLLKPYDLDELDRILQQAAEEIDLEH